MKDTILPTLPGFKFLWGKRINTFRKLRPGHGKILQQKLKSGQEFEH